MNVVEYTDLLRQMKPPALLNLQTLKPDGLTPWMTESGGVKVILF